MSYYEAKFAREAKNKPTDWLIQSMGLGSYKLVYMGGLQ